MESQPQNPEFRNNPENFHPCILYYYIQVYNSNDTTFELSVFWPSDTEIRINELRFSDFLSLSFKTRLTSVTCFCGEVTLSKFQAWDQRRKT